MQRPSNRDIILRMIRRNPKATLRSLMKATGLDEGSNVRYHIRKLSEQGLIQYQGVLRKREGRYRQQQRWAHGTVTMRRMSEAELQSRMDAVVEKARRNGTLNTVRTDAFAENWPVLRHTLKACRIG